ncbi:hypothetical protein [Acinetobacter radioresistens]|nr:hypothetical protein [Acinetobacter radioresistens]AWV87062.1 hypothetical protein DOM24_10855 [Acinetobacter radioresistens]MCX0328937.1 hypothetical protein [Acinetobacter radioresistens]
MSEENPLNQTNLAIAALSASFANALEKHNPGFKDDFLKELEARYYTLRESKLVHTEAMETLNWTRQFIKDE